MDTNCDVNMPGNFPALSKSVEKKPNESGGVYVSTMVKIYDPETNEILVKMRGD